MSQKLLTNSNHGMPTTLFIQNLTRVGRKRKKNE